MNNIQSFIKWTGTKRKEREFLQSLFKYSETYYEPFVGGGSMLYENRSKIKFANDKNTELINLYKILKTDPNCLFLEYRKMWNELQEDGQEVYYKYREIFNKTKDPSIFLFLTRTCVNGIIRYNKKEEFNTSFHLSRPGINPEKLKTILFDWNNIIRDVNFSNLCYIEFLENCKSGDFVFLDPPYIPYENSTKIYFDDKFNYKQLFEKLEHLNNKNVFWMLTFGENEIPNDLYKTKLTQNEQISKMSLVLQTQNQAKKYTDNVFMNY